MKKLFSKRFLISTTASLVVLFTYNNCSARVDTQNLQNPSQSGGEIELAKHNYLTAPLPEPFCGQDGYEFLMDQYLTKYCAGCHDSRGLAQPIFVDPNNISNSYFSAKLINDDSFKDSVLNNKFCGDGCSLSPDGEVYQTIVKWLENKNCN